MVTIPANILFSPVSPLPAAALTATVPASVLNEPIVRPEQPCHSGKQPCHSGESRNPKSINSLYPREDGNNMRGQPLPPVARAIEELMAALKAPATKTISLGSGFFVPLWVDKLLSPYGTDNAVQLFRQKFPDVALPPDKPYTAMGAHIANIMKKTIDLANRLYENPPLKSSSTELSYLYPKYADAVRSIQNLRALLAFPRNIEWIRRTFDPNGSRRFHETVLDPKGGRFYCSAHEPPWFVKYLSGRPIFSKEDFDKYLELLYNLPDAGGIKDELGSFTLEDIARNALEMFINNWSLFSDALAYHMAIELRDRPLFRLLIDLADDHYSIYLKYTQRFENLRSRYGLLEYAAMMQGMRKFVALAGHSILAKDEEPPVYSLTITDLAYLMLVLKDGSKCDPAEETLFNVAIKDLFSLIGEEGLSAERLRELHTKIRMTAKKVMERDRLDRQNFKDTAYPEVIEYFKTADEYTSKPAPAKAQMPASAAAPVSAVTSASAPAAAPSSAPAAPVPTVRKLVAGKSSPATGSLHPDRFISMFGDYSNLGSLEKIKEALREDLPKLSFDWLARFLNGEIKIAPKKLKGAPQKQFDGFKNVVLQVALELGIVKYDNVPEKK